MIGVLHHVFIRQAVILLCSNKHMIAISEEFAPRSQERFSDMHAEGKLEKLTLSWKHVVSAIFLSVGGKGGMEPYYFAVVRAHGNIMFDVGEKRYSHYCGLFFSVL